MTWPRSLRDHELSRWAEAKRIPTYFEAFAVALLVSGRESASPDASYFLGPFPANEMRFFSPPVFAVEVRSENDFHSPVRDGSGSEKRAE